MLKARELIEGVHYYMENGFMVFTEVYHLARGRCCLGKRDESKRCRHCPYVEKCTETPGNNNYISKTNQLS